MRAAPCGRCSDDCGHITVASRRVCNGRPEANERLREMKSETKSTRQSGPPPEKGNLWGKMTSETTTLADLADGTIRPHPFHPIPFSHLHVFPPFPSFTPPISFPPSSPLHPSPFPRFLSFSFSLPSSLVQLGGMGSVVSSPSGVRAHPRPPTHFDHLTPENTSDDNRFTDPSL